MAYFDCFWGVNGTTQSGNPGFQAFESIGMGIGIGIGKANNTCIGIGIGIGILIKVLYRYRQYNFCVSSKALLICILLLCNS